MRGDDEFSGELNWYLVHELILEDFVAKVDNCIVTFIRGLALDYLDR